MTRLAVFLIAGVAALLAATGSSGAPTQGFDAKCGVFPAANVPAGSPSLPDQRMWNQDISKSPVDPNSDRYISYINAHGGDEFHPDFGSPKIYGIPFTVVSGALSGRQGQVHGVRLRSPTRASTRSRSTPRSRAARRATAIVTRLGFDRDKCKLYELYRAFPKKGKWEADGGAIWNLKSAGLRKLGWTSADAAGLPIFPGLTRYDEVDGGEIDHALRVTFDVTQDAYILPASHCASNTKAAGAPPMGLRFRLKDSVNTSGLSGQSAVIATALKKYGMVNADNGSNWFLSGGTDSHWNDDNLNQLKDLRGSDFEVVQSEASVKPASGLTDALRALLGGGLLLGRRLLGSRRLLGRRLLGRRLLAAAGFFAAGSLAAGLAAGLAAAWAASRSLARASRSARSFSARPAG